MRRTDQRASQRRRFSLECLEDRTLLSAASVLVDPGSFAEDQVLVRFRSDDAVSLPAGLELGGDYALVPGLREIKITDGSSPLETLAALNARPDVLYALPDYRIQLSLTPNDTRYGEMWALHNTGQTGGTADADIDAPEAWNVITDASSVIVAVIDTGVDYNHPDLVGNMWTNSGEIAGNGIDDDGNGYIDDIHGYDFVAGDGNPMDEHFHGTHVAGTIGAVGNNSVGVVGVALDVQIMALRFLDANGSGMLSDAISALDYAVANGAHISNNSWGGGGYMQLMRDAIAAAGQEGHIFVAAAGNDGSNNDFFPAYPATYDLDNIISVAATDHNDDLAYFSNYGATTVDLAAPGVSILSTMPRNMTPAMQQYGLSTNYGSISGTSMATPHVSGVAALVRAQHPDWSYNQVIEQILNTVDPIDAVQGITVTGGRLNAAAAVGDPAPDTTGPRVTASTPSGVVTGTIANVRVTFNEAVSGFDASDISSFLGPNGSIAVSEVVSISTNNRQWEIRFDPQSTQGNYSLVLGPNVFDAMGNAMDQNRDGAQGTPSDTYTASFTIGDAFTFASTDVPAPLYPYTITVSELTINQDINIGDLNVQLDITHPSVGNLYVSLVDPTGTLEVILSYFNGGEGDNFQGTIFDDEAGSWLSGGAPPYAGSYRTDDTIGLQYFDGLNARGTWTLWVWNLSWWDSGALNSWSMTIEPSGSTPPPDDKPPTPPPPTNNPPYTGYDYVETNEDASVIVNVLANDGDPDGDAISLVAIDYAYGGSAVINGDSVRFTPDADFNGFAGFSYTISDTHGFTASGWADVFVVPVNDAPAAADDTVAGYRDAALAIDPYSLTGNDVDVDGDSVWVTSVGSAVHGAVAFDPYSGSIVFTPEAGYRGLASFQYTVTDGQASDTATVTVNLSDVFYFSTTAAGTRTGSDGVSVSFSNADIVQLTVDASGAASYRLYFDGSDVGLSTASEDIDAFSMLPDGTLLISTTGAFSVTSYYGTVSGGGEDLIAFVPYAYGADTSGYFYMYFDGSDVGLSGSAENVDAVAVLSDYSILVSTAGSALVPGVSAADTDLMRFVPTSLGGFTQGGWSLYFDGSDVGLSDGTGEDVAGLFVVESGGLPTLHLATRNNFSAGGVAGANEDVVAFRPTSLGSFTSGAFGPGLAFDGSAYGLGGFALDGWARGPISGHAPIGSGGGIGKLKALPPADAAAPSSDSKQPASAGRGLDAADPFASARRDETSAPAVSAILAPSGVDQTPALKKNVEKAIDAVFAIAWREEAAVLPDLLDAWKLHA